MKNIGIISRKELKFYLTSPMAYVVTAVFLVLTGTFFTMYLAGTNYSDTSIGGFLSAGQILILLFAAILGIVGLLGHKISLAVLWVLPLTLIVFMSWAVFWIKPGLLPPQIGVSTSAILTLIAFVSNIISIALGCQYSSRSPAVAPSTCEPSV